MKLPDEPQPVDQGLIWPAIGRGRIGCAIMEVQDKNISNGKIRAVCLCG